MSSEILIGIIIGAIATLLGLALYDSNKPNRHHRKNPPQVIPFLSSNPANPQLMQKLLDLVGGDRDRAEQEIARSRFGHPERSESMCVWLAIRRLERRQQPGEN